MPNTHCATCVGCAKNCYDFKPRAAYQADLADSDPGWSGPRKLFVATLPGFVLGFFMLTGQADIPTPQKFSLLALFVLASIGSFYALEAISPLSPAMLTVTYAAAALNIFYWFTGPIVAAALNEIAGVDVPWLRWPISVTVAALTLLWIARTRVSELQFALTTGARSEPVLLKPPTRRTAAVDESAARVRFDPDGSPVAAEVGMSLSEIAERYDKPLEAGCRMGVCGADPVAILDGASCLSPPESDELNTLRRLGHGTSTRMACCARIGPGTVRVSLTPEPGHPGGATRTHYDRSIVSVVVIGNGIAGVRPPTSSGADTPTAKSTSWDRSRTRFTTAWESRGWCTAARRCRASTCCPISGIPSTASRHGSTPWPPGSTCVPGTFCSAPAMPPVRPVDSRDGASAAIPQIGGLNRPGSHVLREAADAIQIRAYAQQHGCRHAVVAGGGLLGLEAAYSLHLLGLRVTVLERGERLLSRYIDSTCSEMVAGHFAKAGIEILRRAETSHVIGAPAVTGVVLKDHRTVGCAVPRRNRYPPHVAARSAGVPVRLGVLVDDRMRTGVPWVFAAGDVAEHRGQVLGLWPIATEQAQAAAVNALGGNLVLTFETPATILKGVGLELFRLGV